MKEGLADFEEWEIVLRRPIPSVGARAVELLSSGNDAFANP
jgi:hypothetical protein